MRATISEMGPLLFSRMLNLNDTQSGVMALVFKIADDNGLLLLDLKDLQAMLQHVGDQASKFQTQYGNISPASIGTIQRGLIALQQQGGDKFFGEPALNLDDLLQTDANGHGVINILAADKLMAVAAALRHVPAVDAFANYSRSCPKSAIRTNPSWFSSSMKRTCCSRICRQRCRQKIEQVVRLIRSKGVGVYFVTQNPMDVPEDRAGTTGQPCAACPARLHAERSESRASGRPNVSHATPS